MTTSLNDAEIRQVAIDPAQSFIVRAPAGSGKTELLIQRYLNLLGSATQHPSEIIAITFTRKAAFEMKRRILDALQQASDTNEPTSTHHRLTKQLAQAALKKHPELLLHPEYLKIQTIDAFCNTLVEQTSFSLQFAKPPELLTRPDLIYREAAERLLLQLEESSQTADDLARLLQHLDNHAEGLIELIAKILAKREQWLPHLVAKKGDDALRKTFEKALQSIIEEHFEKLISMIPEYTFRSLLRVAKKAGQFLKKDNPENKLALLAELPDPFDSRSDYQPYFEALSQFLVTQDETWRKVVNKNQGFPAPSSAQSKLEKEEFENLKFEYFEMLESLKQIVHLEQTWATVQHLPTRHYNDFQWSVIESLMRVLPLAAAHLRVIFQEKNVVDFTEISMAAVTALQEDQTPTDLALQLDYQIKHFLIDEFQDTSSAHYRFIEQLTAGWEPDDGRTLFLVGDPMQSIYRFRDAEVGLFLHVEHHGLGHLPLTPLALTVNFRAQAELVEWVNHHFQHIFPSNTDVAAGAVSFHAAIAARNKHPGVNVHVNIDALDTIEPIIGAILKQRQDYPQRTLALLVHARSHLETILPYLEDANIPYQATEIKPLLHATVVQDLMALTRALLYPMDRIAWLAILRAPWCQLSLQELLEHAPPGQTVWTAIQNSPLEKLNSFKKIMGEFLKDRTTPLSFRVESLWLALEGHAFFQSPDDLKNATLFFDVLSEFDSIGHLPDFTRVTRRLSQEYASVESDEPNPLKIMTIHKAKGLEFDVVFIPELHRATRAEEQQLLLWKERINVHGGHDLILAPVKRKTDAEYDRCYAFLRREEEKRRRFELARLLYVGVTRARDALYIYAEQALDEEGFKTPAAQSLLAQWLQGHAAVIRNEVA